MTRLRRWFRWLRSRQEHPFWSGRFEVPDPGPPAYCQEHAIHYRGECLHCAGRVCPRPGCGLPKQQDARTCGRDRCEEWDREQHRNLRAVG